MEADDFLLDEEILEHDEFLGRKGKKLPVRLKDRILLGGMFGGRRRRRGGNMAERRRKMACREKARKQGITDRGERRIFIKKCFNIGREIKEITTSTDPDHQACLMEYNLAEKKRRQMGGRIKFRVMSKSAFLKMCINKRKGITLKSSPKTLSWQECSDRLRRQKMRKRRRRAGWEDRYMESCYGSATKIKEEVEEIMPIEKKGLTPVEESLQKSGAGAGATLKGAEVETPIIEVPEETKKKKPPYLLYGALGVVAVLVGIRMFKK